MSSQKTSVLRVAGVMVAIAGSASGVWGQQAQGPSGLTTVQGGAAAAAGQSERLAVAAEGIAHSVAGIGAQRGSLDCGSLSITQSGNPNLIQNGSVWCGTLAVSDENSFARAFEASTAIEIRCVTFGVRQCTGGDWPVRVRLRLGEIEDAYSSHAVVAETFLVIPSGTTSELVVAELGPVSLPAGAKYIVEIQYDSRDIADGGDGGLLTLGFNNQGQSAESYMRAPDCDLDEFVTVASQGFANRHLVMTVSAEERVPAIVMGGYPFEAIGDATLGVEDGDIVVSGSLGQTFGVRTSFGQGVLGTESAPVRWDNQPGSVATSIHRTGDSHKTLSLVGITEDTMRLDVDFGTGEPELFDYMVYDENGSLVGVFENLPSGSIQVQVVDRREIGWLVWRCRWVNRFTGQRCLEGIIWDPNDCVEFCEWVFEAWVGNVSNIGSGLTFSGSSVGLVNANGKPVNPPPPSDPRLVDLVLTDVTSFLLGSSISAGSLSFGNATIGSSLPGITGTWNAVGVPVSAQTNGADVLLQGVMGSSGPELCRKRFDAFPFVDDVQFSVGGVESAQVDLSGLQWTGNVTTSPCLFFSAVQVDGGSGGTVAFDPCVLCPPPQQSNEWTAVTGDFSGVGDGTFTFQAFQNGILVYQQSGLSAASNIGAMSAWPSSLGKLGGDIPCMIAEYPGGTSIWLAANDQTVSCNEIRLVAEGTGGALPLLDSLTISSIGFSEMTFANFTAELPLVPDQCLADLNDDGVIDFFDLIEFLSRFSSSDLSVDFNNDGLLDFFDIVVYLGLFDAGCP